jgi:AAA15 family ATPase/GTPase
MVAASLVSKNKALDEENTIKVDEDLTLLTSAAIYGANASGKSNLASAIHFMRDFVLDSSRGTQIEDIIEVERFRLSTETENAPSSFEVVFILDGRKYRYGFEVTPERVIAEWLFFVPNSREAKLFKREFDNISVAGRFKEGRGIEKRTRPNALFLSVVAQFNGDLSQKILNWFGQFSINSGLNASIDLAMAIGRFDVANDKKSILQFVKDLDLGISDIRSEQVTAPWIPGSAVSSEINDFLEIIQRITKNPLPETVPTVKTVHPKYDAQGNVVGSEIFEFDAQESAGTRRLFGLAFPVLDALSTGHVLFVDELDARLHPLITCTIISLFNSKKSNPKGAQLIFTTHDTNLLSKEIFRRDQIWFVEKDKFGATHLYSLAEFRVRNDASFERDYIQGRYGAIPFISRDLQSIVGFDNGKE